MSEAPALDIRNMGCTPYQETWRLQRELQQALLRDEGRDTLLICEHPPVITLGRSSKREHILAGEEQLAARGIPVFEIERGGDVTWHGPGQVVCYPIIDLNRKRRDVHWYVRGLEEVVIRALAHYGLHGVRVSGKSGVWIEGGGERRKISSVGVRISRWRTLHGFALNARDRMDGFSLIHPCGLRGVRMTSIEAELGGQAAISHQPSAAAGDDLTLRRIGELISRHFKAVFDYH